MNRIDFNPEMVSLARQSREMTKARLSQLTGVSATVISRCESGTSRVSDQILGRIAARSRLSAYFLLP